MSAWKHCLLNEVLIIYPYLIRNLSTGRNFFVFTGLKHSLTWVEKYYAVCDKV